MITININEEIMHKYNCPPCGRIFEELGGKMELGSDIGMGLYKRRANIEASQLVEHTCPIKLFVKAIVKSHRAKRISETRFY